MLEMTAVGIAVGVALLGVLAAFRLSSIAPMALMAFLGVGMMFYGLDEMDRDAEIMAQLAPVARFAETSNDGFTRIVTDRETGCVYTVEGGAFSRQRVPILRTDGTPDCDASRIIPGLAAKRRLVERQIQRQRADEQEKEWW